MSLKMDCKHMDEYIKVGNHICVDWCLEHDCFNCDNCKEYSKK